MPRNMSFAMTREAILNRTKTVTRRKGWDHLLPGDLLWAVEKSMGMKKGEHATRLALIVVKSNTKVALNDYEILTKADVIAEGFPKLEPWAFVFTFCVEMGGEPDQDLSRIEFSYIPEADWEAALHSEAARACEANRIKVPNHLREAYLARRRKAQKRRTRGTRGRLTVAAKIKLLREALARQINYWMTRVSPQIALEDAEQVYNACKAGAENKCDLVSHGPMKKSV